MSDDSLARKLTKARDTLRSQELALERLEGERASCMDRLQREFGCSTVEEAQEKLDDLREELRLKQEEKAGLEQRLDDLLRKMEGSGDD